jgi:serine/threonine protein phosphatase PrpC
VLRAFGLTDKGRIRPINEDCFAIHEDLGLLVVADGMGGHNAGEIAAQVAVDAVIEVVRDHETNARLKGSRSSETAERWSASLEDCRSASLSGERNPFPFGYDPSLSDDGNLLRTAIHVACVQVIEAAGSANQYAGMGTTLVAARVAGGRLSVAHAGDSRLYLLSAGRLQQVTRDDSWVASMLAADPDADPEALQHHPMRNALTNVVGAGARTAVHVAEHELAGGELLLLSTDGVHGVLDGRRLERMMLEEQDPRSIAQTVFSAALKRGSRDNLTAVVARYC